MLSIYDLYDLSGVIKNIRAFPDYPLNAQILEKVIEVLRSRNESPVFNQLRYAIRTLPNLDREKYAFVFVDNYYVYFPSFLKNKKIYELLEKCCNELLHEVKQNNPEKVIALSDCLHNLPTELVENNFQVPKNFWRFCVKSYRKVWDKNFLK